MSESTMGEAMRELADAKRSLQSAVEVTSAAIGDALRVQGRIMRVFLIGVVAFVLGVIGISVMLMWAAQRSSGQQLEILRNQNEMQRLIIERCRCE